SQLPIAFDIPGEAETRLYLNWLLFLKSARVTVIPPKDHAVVRIARARHERADENRREQLAVDRIARAAVGRGAGPARRDRYSTTRLIILRRLRAVVT